MLFLELILKQNQAIFTWNIYSSFENIIFNVNYDSYQVPKGL